MLQDEGTYEIPVYSAACINDNININANGRKNDKYNAPMEYTIQITTLLVQKYLQYNLPFKLQWKE